MRRIKYLGSKESMRELYENREALDKYLKHLKELMEPEELPRRIQIDKLTPAEKAIYDAVQAVENLPPDKRLTDAVNLLSKAQGKVADYVDNITS